MGQLTSSSSGLLATTWSVEPLALVGILAGALLYFAAIRRLRQKGRRWPLKRTLPFCAGLAAIAVATQTPLAAEDTRLFSAHVVQHLLLAMVAPALMCLGAPITLVLQGAPRAAQERLLTLLHSRVVRLVTNPLYVWFLFVGTLFVLYFSPLYELSLRNALFHEAVHIHFVVAGFMFFAPIVAIDPHPYRLHHGLRLLYMGLTLPAHAFLALALMSATTPLAVEWYIATTGRDLATVLTDQKLGAGIMWITGDLLSIATVGIVVTQWIRHDERAAGREDRFIDAREPSPAHRDSRFTARASLSGRKPMKRG